MAESKDLNKKIYELTNKNKSFNRDYGLRDQMRKSCISISSNIAEGFDRESKKGFYKISFYS